MTQIPLPFVTRARAPIGNSFSMDNIFAVSTHNMYVLIEFGACIYLCVKPKLAASDAHLFPCCYGCELCERRVKFKTKQKWIRDKRTNNKECKQFVKGQSHYHTFLNIYIYLRFIYTLFDITCFTEWILLTVNSCFPF